MNANVLALGVTPWTVERPVPQNRRPQHSAVRGDGSSAAKRTMEVSHVVEFVNHTDPFCSLLGDSITVDLESSSSSIQCKKEDEGHVSGSEQRKILSALKAYDLVGVRLSLVGLGLPSRASLSSSQSSKSSLDEQRDELHSSLYSSVLETVRVQLIECVPQITEEMVSKAIINAFADSKMTRHTTDTDEYEQGGLKDKFQVEVDYLWKAVHLRDSCRNKEQMLKQRSFLQDLLDDMFLQIRREVFTSPNQVLRAVLTFLSILQIESDDVYLLRDTILLQGVGSTTTRRALRSKLSQFGEISALAIASRDPTFAYCRFRDEASALQAIQTQTSLTSESLDGKILLLSLVQSYRGGTVVASSALSKCHQAAPSQQRESDQASPVCVSKHICSSI
jgi:RNA recognition motif. (a.k.a. RRM, RBD, or RNP domain)